MTDFLKPHIEGQLENLQALKNCVVKSKSPANTEVCHQIYREVASLINLRIRALLSKRTLQNFVREFNAAIEAILSTTEDTDTRRLLENSRLTIQENGRTGSKKGKVTSIFFGDANNNLFPQIKLAPLSSDEKTLLVKKELQEAILLDFIILPPDETERSFSRTEQNETREVKSGSRLQMAMDILDANGIKYDQPFKSLSSEYRTTPYFALRIPAHQVCALICNAPGNATYFIPSDGWENYVRQHKLSDLRNMGAPFLVWQEEDWKTAFLFQIKNFNALDLGEKQEEEEKSVEPNKSKPENNKTEKSEERCSWLERLEEVKKIKTEKGFWPSRDSKDEEEKSLGRWCNTQRMVFKEGNLSEWKLTALAGICFEFNPLDSQWRDNFTKVHIFKTEQGFWPSQKSEDEEEKRLGVWCAIQRIVFKEGNLSEWKLAALAGICFEFNPLDSQWRDNFTKVHIFKAKEGYWPRERSKNEKEKKLAEWRNIQRRAFKEGKLSSAREKALRMIGLLDFQNK